MHYQGKGTGRLGSDPRRTRRTETRTCGLLTIGITSLSGDPLNPLPLPLFQDLFAALVVTEPCGQGPGPGGRQNGAREVGKKNTAQNPCPGRVMVISLSHVFRVVTCSFVQRPPTFILSP